MFFASRLAAALSASAAPPAAVVPQHRQRVCGAVLCRRGPVQPVRLLRVPDASGAGGAAGVARKAGARGATAGAGSSPPCIGKCSPAQLRTIASAVQTMLEALGEDPTREGLVDTPMRVAKSLAYLTGGSATTLADVVGDAVFDEGTPEDLVLVKDIEFHSMCEHHMLPFSGRAHVGYISSGKVLGLSKVARIVDKYARSLQVQERLTKEVAAAIMDSVSPLGVAVMMEATHMCMCMRGAQASGSSTVTTCYRGTMKTDRDCRAEFLALVRR